MTGISLHIQCAMASDFSVAWQCLSKRTIGFFVTDQTPRPYPTRSLPAQLWHRCTEWSTVWVSSKPLITEENWPGRGLNPGLPNDTPALYPLLYELMLWIKLTLYLPYCTLFYFTDCTLCKWVSSFSFILWWRDVHVKGVSVQPALVICQHEALDTKLKVKST
jgi:hypothetical protein